MIENRQLPKDHSFTTKAKAFVYGVVALGAVMSEKTVEAAVSTIDFTNIEVEKENVGHAYNTAIEYIVTNEKALPGLREEVLRDDKIRIFVTDEEKNGKPVSSVMQPHGRTIVFIHGEFLKKYNGADKKTRKTMENSVVEILNDALMYKTAVDAQFNLRRGNDGK